MQKIAIACVACGILASFIARAYNTQTSRKIAIVAVVLMSVGVGLLMGYYGFETP